MKDKFLTLINNSKVHRFDLNAAGQKNTRDYAYGKSHYSVGENFKAEVVFADKTETTVAKIVIKNKTFNTIVAEFKDADSISAIKHALDNRTMITRFNNTRGAMYQSELDRLATRLH